MERLASRLERHPHSQPRHGPLHRRVDLAGPTRVRLPADPLERVARRAVQAPRQTEDRKSTRLNSSHSQISYAVFCLKKKKNITARKYTTTVCSMQHATVRQSRC